MVGAAVGFSLWTLRAELFDVWFLNDAGIHRSMVGWAAQRIRDGHLPFDGWYPYLSLGASRFHHYQSLPHILTGTASTVLGGGTFRWSLYLLLCTWPIAVYCGGRLFDLEPWAAGVAALVSPLIVSAPALGFEWSSYVWRGSGTWAQLWGMWALPFAWGLTWRAVSKGRTIALAAFVLGITICLHLLIGYLAMLSLGVWVLLAPSDFWRRAGPGGARRPSAPSRPSAWMLVPLLTDAKWMTQDEFSRGTFYYDSFGARRVLGWLVTGRIFDNHRFPVVSVLALIGLGVCVWRFRRTETARAVPAVGLLSLLLFFGRPTLGFVIDLLPGATDLFLRRYVTGVHLAGIYLAGIGGAWVGTKAMHLVRTRAEWMKPAFAAARARRRADRRGRAGGGRALLVRADRRRVDLGAARRPVDGWRRLRLARRDGQGDRSRPDLRRHAREQGGAEDPVRPRVRRAAEPRRRCRGVHAAHVVADVERGEPVRRARRRAGGHVRRALGRPARRT